MQPPRLAFFEAQPDHTADALFHVVVHRDAIAIQEHRGGQGIEAVTLALGDRRIRIKRDPGGDEFVPRVHVGELSSELLRQPVAVGLIERRGESIVDVLGEFVATVAPVPGAREGPEPTAATQADRILASAASDTDDDACLVAVRIR